MNEIYDREGFTEAILESVDEYEPYGYVSPALALVGNDYSMSREVKHDRVVESMLLGKGLPFE